MKLTKENVCVFIENESQLQEAREILLKYGENISMYCFSLKGYKYLQFDDAEDSMDWYMCDEIGLTKINLQQLEEILINDNNFKKEENQDSKEININNNAYDFERDLYKLINQYVSAGLNKTDLVKKMEYVTHSCKVS